jgi:hypothetical protein
MEKQNFQFELGEVIRIKGSYKDAFIKSRGMIEHVGGSTEEVYFILIDGEKLGVVNVHEIERKK